VIKGLCLVLVAGLLLSACGSETEAKAMTTWVTQSDFHENNSTVISDVRHSATALEEPSSAVKLLHSVCDVLDMDVSAANAALPTPDDQSTQLLSKAYTNIDDGAKLCFDAGTSEAKRQSALRDLSNGLALLSEGSQRVDVAAGSSSN
jgi:outer membrane murein-binding lipoprotein Lpp